VSHFNLNMPAEFRLRPWVRAESLPWPDLFWAPVSGFPVREMERQWLGAFLTTLCLHLSGQGLSPCCFLETACIQGPLEEAFLADAPALTPLPGYCRRLWEDPPGPPPPEEIDAIRQGRRPYSHELFCRGMAFWMDPDDFPSFCRRYGGRGGLVILFAVPAAQADPVAAFPGAIFENPLLAQLAPGRDLRREFQQAMRLRDPRMALIKKAFAAGWEKLPHYEKAIFVIPRLKSLDFFSNSPEVFGPLFQAAPVCFYESPPDGGVLLASSAPFSAALAEIMKEVRAGHGAEEPGSSS
jgi:hypothetical protein